MEINTSAGMLTSIPPKPTNLVFVGGQLRKIPRPRNAFMIFANEHRRQFQAMYPSDTNNQISTRLGDAWHVLVKEKKADYFTRARAEDQEHKRKYPFYHYTPSLSKHFKQEMKRVKYINRIRLLSPSSSSDSLPVSVKPQQAVMRVALLKCPESSGTTSSTSTSTISIVAPPTAPQTRPQPLPRQQAPCSSHAHPVVQHTIQTPPMFGQPLTPQPLWMASSPFMHTMVPQPLHTTTILFPSQPYFGSCVDGSIPIHPPPQPRMWGYHHGTHVTAAQRFNAPRKAEPVDGHLLVPETLSRTVLEKFTPFVQARSPPLAGAAHTSSSDASRYKASISSTAPVAPDCCTPPPNMNIASSTGDPKLTGFDGRYTPRTQPYVVSDPRANKRCKLETKSIPTTVPSDIEHISDDETVCAASALMALTTRHNDQHPTESPREISINLMQAAPTLTAQSPDALSSPYQYNCSTVRPPIVGLPPIESVLPSSRRDNFSTTTLSSSASSIAACRSQPASLSTSQCISGAFRLLLDDDHAEVDHMRYSTTESQCSGTSQQRDPSSSSSEVSRSEHESKATVRLIRHDRPHTATDGDVRNSELNTSRNNQTETRRDTRLADHRFITAMYNETVHGNNHAFYPLGDMTGREYDKKTGCPSVIFLPCKASYAAELGWEPDLLPTKQELVSHNQHGGALATDQADGHRTNALL